MAADGVNLVPIDFDHLFLSLGLPVDRPRLNEAERPILDVALALDAGLGHESFLDLGRGNALRV